MTTFLGTDVIVVTWVHVSDVSLGAGCGILNSTELPSLFYVFGVTSLFYLEYILHVHSIKRSLYRFLLTRLD